MQSSLSLVQIIIRIDFHISHKDRWKYIFLFQEYTKYGGKIT